MEPKLGIIFLSLCGVRRRLRRAQNLLDLVVSDSILRTYMCHTVVFPFQTGIHVYMYDVRQIGILVRASIFCVVFDLFCPAHCILALYFGTVLYCILEIP